jgi:L-alanine-DL-glutamate epimerase-like enolase superfamily enzyme
MFEHIPTRVGEAGDGENELPGSHTLIRTLRLWRLRVPLVKPYRLAFGSVEAFDTIVAEAELADGQRGPGEATVLTGYTDETIDDCWAFVQNVAQLLPRLPVHAALQRLARYCTRHPFGVTALATAIDLAAFPEEAAPAKDSHVPILGLLGAHDPAGIEREAVELLAAGYRTVKVKVGFEPSRDIRYVRLVQRALAGRARIRIDANQGYTAEQAREFVRAVDREGIELFEQPCKAGDWDAHMQVARNCPLPLMLDESIYGTDDIRRASQLRAAQFIKLKLMKLGRVRALAAALQHVRNSNMTPVLGNGVACDLGCWAEATIAARLIDNAGEMNGFLKARGGLLTRPLRLERGAIVLEAGYRPELDPARVEPFAVARAAFGG